MIFYEAFIVLLLAVALRYLPVFRCTTLSVWALPSAMILKALVGYIFLYIYSTHYGHGMLSADAGVFMRESKMLNDVFYISPGDYLKFLTGIDNNKELVHHYLGDTSHWDIVPQSIINDNRNILRLHSLIQFFSFGRAGIHTSIFSFFSLIASYQLFLAFRHYTKLNHNLVFVLILVVPSLLFWTSSVLKEPFMLLGIALFLRGLLDQVSRTKRIIYLLLSVFLMINFKPYVMIAILPAVLVAFSIIKLKKLKPILLFLGVIATGIAAIAIIKPIQEKFTTSISRKQFDFVNVAKGGLHAYADSCFYYFDADQFDRLNIDPKSDSVSIKKRVTADVLILENYAMPSKITFEPSDKRWKIYFMNYRCTGYIPLTPIDDSPKQLIKNIPEAYANTLLRPTINDPGSWLKYPAIAEMILIYLFLASALLQRRKLERVEISIVYGLITFILLMSLIIGWVTPVLGAINRYRSPVMLAFVLIAILIFNRPKSLIKWKAKTTSA